MEFKGGRNDQIKFETSFGESKDSGRDGENSFKKQWQYRMPPASILAGSNGGGNCESLDQQSLGISCGKKIREEEVVNAWENWKRKNTMWC